jgi:hypothetical protein
MSDLYDPVMEDLNKFVVKFVLSPELWEKFDLDGLNIDYTRWSKEKMLDSNGNLNPNISHIPTDCGGIYVYAIVTPNIVPNCGIYIMYVGKATKTKDQNLRARVRAYQKQFGDDYNRTKLHKLFTQWGKYIYVYYLPVSSSKEDITSLEDRLIAAFGRPPCNKEILIKTVKDAVDAIL